MNFFFPVFHTLVERIKRLRVNNYPVSQNKDFVLLPLLSTCSVNQLEKCLE